MAVEFMRIGEIAEDKPVNTDSSGFELSFMQIGTPQTDDKPQNAARTLLKDKSRDSLDYLRKCAKNAQSNAKGHTFEQCIISGCEQYKRDNKAVIDKTPEPFRVMRKSSEGLFTGRFTSPAQPDFQGTVKGGRSIVFEAKSTTKDRIQRRVLTDTQMKVLEQHEKAGAICGVVCCIGESAFFVPWCVWRDMKAIYGRQYVTAADIDAYKVRYDISVHFLDNMAEVA